MFRFENPEFFVVFVIVPIALAGLLLMRYRINRNMQTFATSGAADRLLGGWSRRKITVSTILVLGGLLFLCLALVNPQWGLRRETVEAKSADIFIALDISNSMYAQDIAPSRLERAKRFAQELVEQFKGDRIGLILFAGNAYLQMPLTNDYASAALFIRSAHPGLASTQGTAIGDAVELALRAYEEDEAHHKALVVITDGENHEDGAIDMMQRGRAVGLIPFVVGVGTAEGAPIPIHTSGQQDQLRDEKGVPVRTALNEAFIRELAAAGDGFVYSIRQGGVIDDMKKQIANLERRDVEQRSFREYESYFQYFLLVGIIFMLTLPFIGNRKPHANA